MPKKKGGLQIDLTDAVVRALSRAGAPTSLDFQDKLAEAIAREDSWGRNFVPAWKGFAEVNRPKETNRFKRDMTDLEEELRQTRIVKKGLEESNRHLTVALRLERRENKRLRWQARKLLAGIKELTNAGEYDAKTIHSLQTIVESLLEEEKLAKT